MNSVQLICVQNSYICSMKTRILGFGTRQTNQKNGESQQNWREMFLKSGMNNYGGTKIFFGLEIPPMCLWTPSCTTADRPLSSWKRSQKLDSPIVCSQIQTPSINSNIIPLRGMQLKLILKHRGSWFSAQTISSSESNQALLVAGEKTTVLISWNQSVKNRGIIYLQTCARCDKSSKKELW